MIRIEFLFILIIALNICFALKCSDVKAKNDELRKKGAVDLVGPVCTASGDYDKVQCIVAGCFCANVKTGERIGNLVRWGTKLSC
ncbi:hypothetical protein B4U80_11857 [Leptotrombidium deliense]|uniref:Thyroglobulin type-1 domain-containing protein n=1 Tax=Leptotrombidium deliense TaxID=299467 RepID=A0A443S1M7_9ACAR|nr:hypothetical protein B4U80_11857 [Leptotrombidium deliense]